MQRGHKEVNMKCICILFVILCFLTSCDSKIYDIPEVKENEQKYYHINESDFSFAESDDRALNTTQRIMFNPGNIRYADGVMYITSYGMVYRYDIEDGGVISLCIDPLCMHKDADCPFYGLNIGSNVIIHQNKVYYKRKFFVHQTDTAGNVIDSEEKRESVCFDIASRKLSVLDTWEYGTYIESEYFHGDYRYYLHTIIGDDNTPTYSINREHLTSRKVETLLELNEWIAGILHTDGTSVWLSDGVGIYRFPIESPKQLETVYTGSMTGIFSGGYIYGKQENQLLRLDAQTGDVTVICTLDFTPAYFCLTRDYIYFRSGEQISYGRDKTQNAGQEIFNQTSDIYRVSVNGGDAELVYRLSEEMKNYYIGNFLVDGNYLYAQWGYCDTEASEYYESWNDAEYDFMRIDLRTGEIYYIAE